MSGLILTTTELRNVLAFADAQPSKSRTYHLLRDSSHRLAILNPDGRLFYVSRTVEAGRE